MYHRSKLCVCVLLSCLVLAVMMMIMVMMAMELTMVVMMMVLFGADLPVQRGALDGDRQVAPGGVLRALRRRQAVRTHPVRQGQDAPVDQAEPRHQRHP